VKIDVSIGYAPIDVAGGSSNCLGLADLAMYEAKRSKSGVLMWQGEKIK
jgi:GGDEF domain-containing protein